MASDINMVALVGRLTRDSELKHTNGGTAVLKCAMAVNRRVKKGDAWVDEASFFDVTLWGKQGEALAQYLVKGQQIALSGELRQERWEQDGQKRSRIEVVANNVELLGRPAGAGDGPAPQQQEPNQAAGGREQAAGYDDDIPF